MDEFREFRRKEKAQLRKVTEQDLNEFKEKGFVTAHETKYNVIVVSISDVDASNGSPKIGDMVARNPKNHLDQWLVSRQYFEDNFDV